MKQQKSARPAPRPGQTMPGGETPQAAGREPKPGKTRRENTPEQQQKLELWAARLSEAKAAFATQQQKIDNWEKYYEGTHTVRGAAGQAARSAGSVRNIVYELIESQIDSGVPLPKVTAVHGEDVETAHKIEAYLRGEVARMNFALLNDWQERTVPIQGGAFWELGWDSLGGTHCSPGALQVKNRHPRQIIPQPGVYELEEMDYLFECLPETARHLREKYGVCPERTGAGGREGTQDEMLTLNLAYYRNRQGGIGQFAWAEDLVLEDLEDYQAVDAQADSGEQPQSGERRRAARYRPKEYPLVLRRNVSCAGRLLGMSDVEQIADQQESIKKMGSKIEEKILKGGSFVTLPQGVGVETSDRELKVIRLKTPAEKALIDVLNIQPDVSKEMSAAAQSYDWAKSTLGITDSFQGKADSTAQSGKAKQFAANQSAGRLQSKRVMKNAAYAELYKKMFHFLLAYADRPLGFCEQSRDGSVAYGHFDPAELLRTDAAGETYWNDEFLFDVDNSAALANNRQSMWNETRTNFTSGAFGAVTDSKAQLAYWTMLAKYDYPGAEDMKSTLQQRIALEGAAGLGSAAGLSSAALPKAGAQPAGGNLLPVGGLALPAKGGENNALSSL